jgi:hypothetical protein
MTLAINAQASVADLVLLYAVTKGHIFKESAAAQDVKRVDVSALELGEQMMMPSKFVLLSRPNAAPSATATAAAPTTATATGSAPAPAAAAPTKYTFLTPEWSGEEAPLSSFALPDAADLVAMEKPALLLCAVNPTWQDRAEEQVPVTCCLSSTLC